MTDGGPCFVQFVDLVIIFQNCCLFEFWNSVLLIRFSLFGLLFDGRNWCLFFNISVSIFRLILIYAFVWVFLIFDTKLFFVFFLSYAINRPLRINKMLLSCEWYLCFKTIIFLGASNCPHTHFRKWSEFFQIWKIYLFYFIVSINPLTLIYFVLLSSDHCFAIPYSHLIKQHFIFLPQNMSGFRSYGGFICSIGTTPCFQMQGFDFTGGVWLIDIKHLLMFHIFRKIGVRSYSLDLSCWLGEFSIDKFC